MQLVKISKLANKLQKTYCGKNCIIALRLFNRHNKTYVGIYKGKDWHTGLETVFESESYDEVLNKYNELIEGV